MNRKSIALYALAQRYREELSQHPVLREHWADLSLVLKGSTARGNADRYSDVDLVFFCDGESHRSIVDAYHALGMIQRTDGVFLPLGDWLGHYSFETFSKLSSYFAEADYPQIWEYTNVIALHDPSDRYRTLVESHMPHVLKDPVPVLKSRYLALQLDLDWLRHPLRRGEPVAAMLHCARIIQGACQISYLMDGKCYPHDKWLFTYVGTTRFGKANRAAISAYTSLVSCPIEKHLELGSYPQYAQAETLISDVAAFIRKHYGAQPWLDEWWLYV